MQLSNNLLTINRLEKHRKQYYEIKDPSIVQVAADKYLLYASIGNSVRQEWIVGRFASNHPTGEWQELEPVVFTNLSGPQLCAPAVTFSIENGKPLFEMYIQTACFEEDGQIVYASSTDGQHFVGKSQPLVTKNDVKKTEYPVVGVYDVGISEVSIEDKNLLCMMYSGYRNVGCGDIYVSYKSKLDVNGSWTRGERLIAQEDLPFHNRPDSEYFEWGLEGAKLIQLNNNFMIIGVCFIPKPDSYLGTRQRVFMAAAKSIEGPFRPIGLPFSSRYNEQQIGENGHPDTIIQDDTLWVIYQERLGNGKPWHLRCASFNLPTLENFISSKIDEHSVDNKLVQPSSVEAYHFDYNY